MRPSSMPPLPAGQCVTASNHDRVPCNFDPVPRNNRSGWRCASSLSRSHAYPGARWPLLTMPYFDLDLAPDAASVRARLDAGAPLIACLCAEWCGACREYRDVFTALSDAHPSLCFVWIDIENQSDVADVFDVENFPTVVIEEGDITRFAGTLLPQRGILERLLDEFTKLPGTGATAQLGPLLRG